VWLRHPPSSILRPPSSILRTGAVSDEGLTGFGTSGLLVRAIRVGFGNAPVST